MLFGITGLWLVPGLWLSALVARTGSGQPAWLGTRIATTLIWYALAGPVINRAGEGAAVTTGGLIIMTVAATTAVLVGVAVGLSKWPKDPWVRTLAPALVGAACAQVAIWVSMRMWTSGMNYEHIRRLDWLIVMCCGLLVALGTMARPKMPPMRTRRDLVGILIALAVVAATVCSIRLSSSVWSPAQLMPSVLSAEQTTAPRGADLAFALTGFGPDGARLFDLADFIVSDDTGHRVPVSTSIERSEDAPNTATLLVVLMPDGRPLLCRSIGAAKLTVRDAASGVQIQAVVPHGWCTA
jgi:hypothetical protein